MSELDAAPPATTAWTPTVVAVFLLTLFVAVPAPALETEPQEGAAGVLTLRREVAALVLPGFDPAEKAGGSAAEPIMPALSVTSLRVEGMALPALGASTLLAEPAARAALLEAADPRSGFQWGPAIRQSAMFLGIQQSYMISQNRWYRREVFSGPFFKEWFESVRGIQGWDDGDPFFDNYIAHSMQGSLTGYIQVQNDPRGMRQEFGRSGAYWKSRLKAMAWNAAYSTQFEIGPISEASIGNLGKHTYRNEATNRVTTGMGMVDLVVTPFSGLGWMVMEDALDRYLIKRREQRDGRPRHFLRVLLNPTRAAANVLRGRAPWHRDTRLEMELMLAARPERVAPE